MKPDVFDYQSASPQPKFKKKWSGFGIASMAFSIVGIFGYIFYLPMEGLAFVLGILSIYGSRGRTVCGWIGFAISALAFGLVIWEVLTGR